MIFLQAKFTTFKPELQGVKNIKTTKIDDKYIVTCIRIDKRQLCCNKVPHIKDYKTVKIILPSHKGLKVIAVKKQRYVCPVCGKIHNSNLEFVDKRNTISKDVKQHIKKELSQMKSLKQIAKENYVSSNTVNRILQNIDINQIKPKQIDSQVLYMDEFKSDVEKEKYSLALYDKKHDLIEVLKNRKTQTIKKYLKQNNINPHTVVTDMFNPFRSLIKSNNKDTQIVADKYHVVRQYQWFLRDIRIELFNKDKEKYKQLKKYWKLLSINSVKTPLTKDQQTKLKQILKLDENLKKGYYIVKEFYKIIEMKKPLSFEKRLEALIEKIGQLGIKQAEKLKQTTISWKNEIINIVKYNITNGFVEGNNNKIKVIKRTSYGFRNYDNFRKLIFLRLKQS